MLVLTRKLGQVVNIGNDIEVVVKDIIKNLDGSFSISLGFDAPKYISIDRAEVRIKRMSNLNSVFNGNNK